MVNVCVLLYFCNNFKNCKFTHKMGFFRRIGIPETMSLIIEGYSLREMNAILYCLFKK